MSKPAHTPGPWGWYAEDASMAILCGYDESGNLDPFGWHVMALTICKSCAEGEDKWEWGRCSSPNEANATLIAAAPEMYETLRDYADTYCEGWCKENGGYYDDCGGCKARAAIAKAEGRG